MTKSEQCWGPLRMTRVLQPAFRPTLPDMQQTTLRYPNPQPHSGREPGEIAKALAKLGRKGAPR